MAEISARKRIWGWMMFDWASQPFYTLLLTFVFGPYFAEVARDLYQSQGMSLEDAKADAQSTWSAMLMIVGVFIAVTAPVLGALADASGRRIPWMILFSGVYVIATWALWWLLPDGSMLTVMLIAFGCAMIASEYMLVFINAILPSLASKEDIGQLSGSGFAFGYAGGVLALFIALIFIAESGDTGKTLANGAPAFGMLDADAREGTRAVGPFTAIWFAVFMVPFFLWVRDPEPTTQISRPKIKDVLRDLMASLEGLIGKTSLSSFLLSSMFYRDALNAIYGFGGVYALLVLQWDSNKLGVFGILAAISAAILTYVGGRVDRRRGPKPVIVANAWILIVVTLVIVCMSRTSLLGLALPAAPVLVLPLLGELGVADCIMFVLGIVIGGASGAMQGASRTMMARHADPKRPTEAFGLYAFSGKATVFLAPALIFIVTQISGSARIGLSPIIFLFIIALILLRWVHPDGHDNSK